MDPENSFNSKYGSLILVIIDLDVSINAFQQQSHSFNVQMFGDYECGNKCVQHSFGQKYENGHVFRFDQLKRLTKHFN